MVFKRPDSFPSNLKDANRQLGLAWDAIAELKACEESLRSEIDELKKQLEDVLEQQGKSSRNSSKPPSSDSDHQRKKRRRKSSSNRQRGAQPGHKKHERPMHPSDQVDQVHQHFPDHHCRCGGCVVMNAEPSIRHQVFELPPPRYIVDEHQVFDGRCERCHRLHVGTLPADVSSGQMGPRLRAWVVMMSGKFRQSVRMTQSLLREQYGLYFSTGAICQVQGKSRPWLNDHYVDIGNEVRGSTLCHADETSHWHRADRAWMWVLVSNCAALFLTHYSRGKQAAAELLGDFHGYLVTDQFVGYDNVDTFKRQLCWAHLIRKFVAMSERRGRGGQIGKRLLFLSHLILRTRHRYELGQIDRARYRRRTYRLSFRFEDTVEAGCRLQADSRTANQCKYLLPNLHQCWRFLEDDRIPLTNNLAERTLRPYVIWRKLSHGTQSSTGCQFRSMVLSVVHTLELLNIPLYEFLHRSCEEYTRTGGVQTRIDFKRAGLPKSP